MSSEEKYMDYFSQGTGWNLCCKQATYLLLKKEELSKLSFKEGTSLTFHMFICKFCRAFKKQSALMNKFINLSVSTNTAKLKETERNALKQLIDKNLS